MNFLNIFEDRIAGVFGSAQAPLSFKKLAKQAAREMEDQTLVINGADTAPALYTILIAADDDAFMAPYYPQLARETAEFVKAQAEKKHYGFVGEPLVRFMIDPQLKPGKFSVFAENVDHPTLARLYEEERAYYKGIEPEPMGGRRSAAPAQTASRSAAPQAGGLNDRVPQADPFAAPATDDPFGSNRAGEPIPVPKTMTRDQLAAINGAGAAAGAAASAGAAAGMGGAAAVASAAGIAGVAAAATEAESAPRGAHMAHHHATATPRANGQLVDVVTGDTYDLTSPRVIVGRERSSADVVLRDPNVSRSHAELTFTGNAWTIEDLNSTNGTLVNNRRISRCPLRNGDMLTFGLSTFEFRG